MPANWIPFTWNRCLPRAVTVFILAQPPCALPNSPTKHYSLYPLPLSFIMSWLLKKVDLHSNVTDPSPQLGAEEPVFEVPEEPEAGFDDAVGARLERIFGAA